MSGAVYCMSDCIYFEVLNKIGDQYYLHITVSDEHDVQTYLFAWNKVPQNIMNIYQYIDSRSFFDKTNALFGCHMLRKGDDVFKLMKYPENPIGKDVNISDSYISDYDQVFFDSLWQELQEAKNI